MIGEAAAMGVPMIIFGLILIFASLYIWLTDELPDRRKAEIAARHRGAERYKITFSERNENR